MDPELTDHNTSERLKKALGLALDYLARQPRTEHDIREYLEKRQYEESIVLQVIEYLRQKNYVNDFSYAQWFIQSRSRNNPKSRWALSHELRQKGVETKIFAPLLEEIDEQSLAFAAIERKIETWKKQYDREKCKKKVFSHLSCRGFGFQIIQTVWDQVEQDKDYAGI